MHAIRHLEYHCSVSEKKILKDIMEKHSPQDVDNSNPFENKAYYMVYYEQIVKAYVLE